MSVHQGVELILIQFLKLCTGRTQTSMQPCTAVLEPCATAVDQLANDYYGPGRGLPNPEGRSVTGHIRVNGFTWYGTFS